MLHGARDRDPWVTVVTLAPGPSQVVRSGELARAYGKSPKWARRLLREWWNEQQGGGEVRVIGQVDGRGRLVLSTTRAILHRHLPPARDAALVRAVESLGKDLDFMARRLDREASERQLLTKKMAELELRLLRAVRA